MSIYEGFGIIYKIKDKLEECNYDKKYEDYIIQMIQKIIGLS